MAHRDYELLYHSCAYRMLRHLLFIPFMTFSSSASVAIIVLLHLGNRRDLRRQSGVASVTFCLPVTLLQPLKSWTRKLCTASRKQEHYSRRNRKLLKSWPPAGIWPVAQTQEHQVAVTKSSRFPLSGCFAFAAGSKESIGAALGDLPVGQAQARSCRPETNLSYWGCSVGVAVCSLVPRWCGVLSHSAVSSLYLMMPVLIHPLLAGNSY